MNAGYPLAMIPMHYCLCLFVLCVCVFRGGVCFGFVCFLIFTNTAIFLLGTVKTTQVLRSELVSTLGHRVNQLQS